MKRRWKGLFVKDGKHCRLSNFVHSSIDDKAAEESEEVKITDSVDEWREGRRVIELGHLADQLRECRYQYCSRPILLHNIEREQQCGLASILYIQCECGFVNTVTTGKSHRLPDKKKMGKPVYDLNTKAVLGVVHAGLTYRQVNAFMATIEVKGLHHTTMMRRREEIHPHIEDVAKQSCQSALLEEADMKNKVEEDSLKQNHSEQTKMGRSNERNQQVDTGSEEATNSTEKSVPDGQVRVKYDMGWQMRGSGRAYDSKSGVGTLIGNETGKVCGYGVRLTDCRMCSTSSRRDHVCHKN